MEEPAFPDEVVGQVAVRDSRQLTPVFPLSRPDGTERGPVARVADRAVPV